MLVIVVPYIISNNMYCNFMNFRMLANYQNILRVKLLQLILYIYIPM